MLLVVPLGFGPLNMKIMNLSQKVLPFIYIFCILTAISVKCWMQCGSNKQIFCCNAFVNFVLILKKNIISIFPIAYFFPHMKWVMSAMVRNERRASGQGMFKNILPSSGLAWDPVCQRIKRIPFARESRLKGKTSTQQTRSSGSSKYLHLEEEWLICTFTFFGKRSFTILGSFLTTAIGLVTPVVTGGHYTLSMAAAVKPFAPK